MELAVGFARATELRTALDESKARAQEIKDRVKQVERQNRPLEDLYKWVLYQSLGAKI